MDPTTSNPVLQQSGGSLQPQSSTQLQQPGSGLQPQTSSLQTTTSLSINQVNALDSGGASIPLAKVGTVSTATEPVPPPPAAQMNWWLAAGVGLIVFAFCWYISNGLMRHR